MFVHDFINALGWPVAVLVGLTVIASLALLVLSLLLVHKMHAEHTESYVREAGRVPTPDELFGEKRNR